MSHDLTFKDGDEWVVNIEETHSSSSKEAVIIRFSSGEAIKLWSDGWSKLVMKDGSISSAFITNLAYHGEATG